MAFSVRRNNNGGSAVAPWDPFTELDRLNSQLSGLLDTWRRGGELLGGGFTPSADVEESPEDYAIEIELPGIKRDDVDIEIAGRRISVRGERKEKERAGILRRQERTIGRFTYEVTLPGEVDEDGVRAHLDDGVLTVHVPKAHSERPRRIQIG